LCYNETPRNQQLKSKGPSLIIEPSESSRDRKVGLNNYYQQLKKLEEKKMFSPITEKKLKATLGDNSTRKFVENRDQNEKSRKNINYEASKEVDGKRNNNSFNNNSIVTPIKFHIGERYRVNAKTDIKVYNNPSPNAYNITQSSANIMDEMNQKKQGLTPKLEDRYSHSRNISVDDSISLKKANENPKSKEILNINCKNDFNLKELCKMDSIFDTQNDIRNLQHMREKLISMIKSYQKEERCAPPTSLDFYKLIKLIGKGAFGKVHLAVNVLTEKYVAIKCIGKTHMNDRTSKKKIFNEITILKNINHPNIIRLLEVFSNHKYIFLVMEYAPQGDLLKYVKKKGKDYILNNK
jgi:hypothetical protein